MSTEIDPDTLTREKLAEHNPIWKALADVLDEWLYREHGVSSSFHGVGLFLHLLDNHGENGFQVVAKPVFPAGFICEDGCPENADGVHRPRPRGTVGNELICLCGWVESGEVSQCP